MYRSVSSRSGQVGIAVILMMVVMSTIGFSLALRATSDIQTSRQSQEAAETFDAAESTIEYVLSQGEAFLETQPSGDYSAIPNVESAYEVTSRNSLDIDLKEGVTAEVDLGAPLAGQQVNIEWGTTVNCLDDPASLAFTIINTAGAAPVARYSASALCSRTDNIPTTGTVGTTYIRRVTLTLQLGDSVLRITPLYNDTPVFVSGAGALTLPVQQFSILSVAQNTRGNEAKAIEVQRTKETAPTVLNYAVVSGTVVVK